MTPQPLFTPQISVPRQRTRVYVVGAYIPNGGTFMAYHLARILRLDFDHDVTVVTVGGETADHGVFVYDHVFPTIPVTQLEHVIAPSDILICNLSFSPYNFGIKLNCFKLMYIQGFTTSFLDCFFDHYVTVSHFVHDFIMSTYDIETTTIPAFIQVDRYEPAAPWDDRPAHSITINLKGDGEQQRLLLARLRKVLDNRAPEIAAAIDWEGAVLQARGKLPARELLRLIGAARYFLTLSAAEGFGLLPLEAMALGATVVGFDGFGGRHYMRPGVNCAVCPYAHESDLADRIIAVMRDPAYAAALAQAGRGTAAEYSHERFRAAWIAEFECALAKQRALAKP
jgi:Glycosyl transferases group 1